MPMRSRPWKTACLYGGRWCGLILLQFHFWSLAQILSKYSHSNIVQPGEDLMELSHFDVVHQSPPCMYAEIEFWKLTCFLYKGGVMVLVDFASVQLLAPLKWCKSVRITWWCNLWWNILLCCSPCNHFHHAALSTSPTKSLNRQLAQETPHNYSF